MKYFLKENNNNLSLINAKSSIAEQHHALSDTKSCFTFSSSPVGSLCHTPGVVRCP